MDSFIVKDPKDCTGAELDSFLASKGYGGLKRLDKAEKIELAQEYLKRENRNTIIFRKPKTILGKAVFAARKLVNKTSGNYDALNIETNFPTAPSEVSSLSLDGRRRIESYFQSPITRH